MLNQKWESLAPIIYHFDETKLAENYTEIAKSIRGFYMGDKKFSDDHDTVKLMAKMLGDRFFV